jgi:hypothetical protein
MSHLAARWMAIRRGRGDLPPLVDGLEFFGNLSSPNTSIVSGAVATLGDSSGRGRHVTQATGTKRPAYNSSDANFGGRPSMGPDGVDDFLLAAAFAASSGNACTLVAVFRQGATGANQNLMTFTTAANGTRVYNASSGLSLKAEFNNPANTATRRSATTALATTYRVFATFDATTGSTGVREIYLNNVEVSASEATAASNGGPLVSMDFSLFGNNGGTGLFSGTCVDPMVYSGRLSATEIARVDDWLKWRNGL